MIRKLISAGILCLACATGVASGQTIVELPQAPSPSQRSSRWIVAKRGVLAIRYKESNQTTVNMSGTALAPQVMGKADVEYKQGRTNVRLEMDGFVSPQSLGGFYTSYILWAVAPEGQAENLMELPIGKKFKIESTTKFQTFGLIITAEPHSSVELPSAVIVAANTLRKGTEGAITTSTIEYSGDPGTFYVPYAPNSPAGPADINTPLLILGARRSVEIAHRADAQRFADAELRDAEAKLAALEQAWPRSNSASDNRASEKKNSGLAHDVMRIAEHARKLSVERAEQAQLSTERRQSDLSVAQAQSEADRARINAERSSNDAERARMEAARAKVSEQEQANRALIEAETARLRVARAQTEAEIAKTNEGLAVQAANLARIQTDQANRERDAARQTLYVSLSEILETRRETRGLIVNLSDVLFDTGKSTLKAGTREKLSKLAGILIAYPGVYQIEVEGHTDSVGSDESNLTLSRGRAESVRDYLVTSGLKSETFLSARGLGESMPIAGNETAAGRQVNRRVEIIIEDQLKQAGIK